MAGDVEMLPGLEEFCREVVDRPGAQDLSDGRRYTATVLLRDYPTVYQAVTRALFLYRLPIRTIADLMHVAASTVMAVRDQAIASGTGAAAFFNSQRSANQREIIKSRLLDAVQERLTDPDALAEINTNTLVTMLATLERSSPAPAADVPPARADVTVVDADALDRLLGDGLIAGKNSARDGIGDSGSVGSADGSAADGSADGSAGGSADGSAGGSGGSAGAIVVALVALGCSMWSGFGVSCSFPMSNTSAYYQGISASWCNSRCNSPGLVWEMVPTAAGGRADRADSAEPVGTRSHGRPAELDGRTPPAPAARPDRAQGAGGTHRGARDAGVTQKCIEFTAVVSSITDRSIV